MLLALVVGSFVVIYQDFVVAKAHSWEQVTHRVMDSMLPFQERIHKVQGRYVFGVNDRSLGDQTLKDAIGWTPSVTDSNRYVAHVVGNNTFKVIATGTQGQTLCRMYPSKQPCFDISDHVYHAR